VQDHAAAHVGQHFARHADSFEPRLRRQIALGCLGVRRLDRRMIHEPRKRHADGAVTARRRRPLEPRRGAATLHDGVGERADAFIQNGQRLAE
jgi:hypothetical protein